MHWVAHMAFEASKQMTVMLALISGRCGDVLLDQAYEVQLHAGALVSRASTWLHLQGCDATGRTEFMHEV